MRFKLPIVALLSAIVTIGSVTSARAGIFIPSNWSDLLKTDLYVKSAYWDTNQFGQGVVVVTVAKKGIRSVGPFVVRVNGQAVVPPYGSNSFDQYKTVSLGYNSQVNFSVFVSPAPVHCSSIDFTVMVDVFDDIFESDPNNNSYYRSIETFCY